MLAQTHSPGAVHPIPTCCVALACRNILVARDRVAVQEASARARRRHAVVSARALASEAERDEKQEEVKEVHPTELCEPMCTELKSMFQNRIATLSVGWTLLVGAYIASPAKTSVGPASLLPYLRFGVVRKLESRLGTRRSCQNSSAIAARNRMPASICKQTPVTPASASHVIDIFLASHVSALYSLRKS